MTKVHGIVYVVMGSAMLFYVRYIESKAHTSFPALLWFSIGFLIWGAFRLTSDYMIKPKSSEVAVEPPAKKREPELRSRISDTHGHVRTHHHVKPHLPVHQRTHQHISGDNMRRCPSCHHLSPSNARFCYFCGYRFF